jgi:hypothetical protein
MIKGKECIHVTNIIVKYCSIAIADHRLVDWCFTIFVNISNVSAIVDRRIGVIVSVHGSLVLDCGLYYQLGQTRDY